MRWPTATPPCGRHERQACRFHDGVHHPHGVFGLMPGRAWRHQAVAAHGGPGGERGQ